MIENLDHLALDYPTGVSHVSQHGKRPTSVKLFFVTPNPEHDPPFNIVSIRIPVGVPIYRINNFEQEMVNKLTDIYGPSWRLNLVNKKESNELNWSLDRVIPKYDVVYA